MAGVDEALQSGRPAVRVLRRADVDAVVAPVARAGKLRDRHQLDRRDAEVFERVEMLDDGVERAFPRECSDVQFVDDVVLERDAASIRRRAIRTRATTTSRRPMHALAVAGATRDRDDRSPLTSKK